MSRSRCFCFTLNNYTDEEVLHVQGLDCRYLVFGREIGENLTPHLQGYIAFELQKSFAAVKKLIPRAHLEAARGSPKQAADYCCKDGDVFEKGVRPMSQKEKGECGRQSIKERWTLAEAGKFDELPPENIRTYEYIHRKSVIPVDNDKMDNLWIQGLSGCGKSRYCRDTYPGFFTKGMNKWWDGYNLEEVVVLDDFDPKNEEFMSRNLKIWSDHYAFPAEVKCGMMNIRPKVFIVTSQYTIDRCFQEPETRDAIKRRFKVIDMFPAETSYACCFNP